MRAIIVGAALLALSPAICASEENPFEDTTTQALYQNCKSETNLRWMACVKYLQGIYDMMSIVEVIASSPKISAEDKGIISVLSVCPSPPPTVAAMRQIFIKWAEDNPTKWSENQAMSAWTVIQKTWPCR